MLTELLTATFTEGLRVLPKLREAAALHHDIMFLNEFAHSVCSEWFIGDRSVSVEYGMKYV